jgi:tetratricopeptide (TPR) repeat protein
MLWIAFAVQSNALLAQQSQTDLAQLQKYLRSGQYQEAEAGFRNLATRNGGSADVLDGLATALQMQGKTNEAIPVFERTLKLKRLPDAVASLAVDYCRNHQFDHADPLLKEAGAFLDDLNFAAMLGPCYLEANQPEIAVTVYERLVAAGISPRDENTANLVRSYFDLSQKALQQLIATPEAQNYAHVITEAQKDGSYDATALFPQAYRAATYLRPEMSVSDLASLLGTHSGDAALLYLLSVRAAEQAQDLFDHMQQQWPGSVPTGELIAEFKDASGDRDGAIHEYEQLQTEHPDAPAAMHFALGLLYAERLRWQDALAQYRIASPDGKGGLYITQRISECLLRTGEDKALERLLRDVVQGEDAPFWALRDYGEAEENQANASAALKYLIKASALEPADASIHYRLFQLYKELSQKDAAAREMALFHQLRTKQ